LYGVEIYANSKSKQLTHIELFGAIVGVKS